MKWQSVWGLPKFFHNAIRFVTGYVLVCCYDESTHEPVEFYWQKWSDYAWKYIFNHWHGLIEDSKQSEGGG